MPLDVTHPDYWTEALQFTPTVHRDVYPALDPLSDRMQAIAKKKVVVVTGAGSGFGKGACLQWAKAGAAAVVLAGRREKQLREVGDMIAKLAPTTATLGVVTDVSSEMEVGRLFTKVLADYGRVDVVIHCAGVLGPVAKIGKVSVDEWWHAFEINTKGAFLVARAFASVAAKQNGGTFINTGSAASYFASSGQSSYTMSKCAINMLVDQLAAEYDTLRVFNVHPGMTKTSVLRPELEIYGQDRPELFGSFTVYLSSSQASFLQGRFVAVNWDVDELEKHKKQIVKQGLLKNQAFRGTTGPGGHKFDS